MKQINLLNKSIDPNKPHDPNKPNNPDKLVELYCGGNPNFGRQSSMTIFQNGLGVDQITFKVVLPDLPMGLNYKKFCIYDLIDNISLEIGGIAIFNFTSKQLCLFDHMVRNINDIIKCATISDNKILYPFDLKHFFGKSESDDKNLISKLDMGFNGFRLVDCDHQEMKFIIRLKKIFNIIDDLNINDDCAEKLEKLSLVDMVGIVHYVESNDERYHPYCTTKIVKLPEIVIKEEPVINQATWFLNPLSLFYTSKTQLEFQSDVNVNQSIEIPVIEAVKYPKISQLTQKWIVDDLIIGTFVDNFKYKIAETKGKISKIIFHSKMLDKVKFFKMQLNGYDYMERVDIKEYKKMYEYNNNVILDDQTFIFNVEITPNITYACFSIWFNEPCSNFEMDYIYNEEITRVYTDGVLV